MDELEMRAFELELMLLYHRQLGDVDPEYARSIRIQIRKLRTTSRTYSRLIFNQAA